MSRRRHDAEHASHDRWLVSYADFITLLFAFFVVLFASSQTDKAKAHAVSEAVSDAFNQGAAARKLVQILGGTVDEAGKGNAAIRGPGGSKLKGPSAARMLETAFAILSKDLGAEIGSGSVQLRLTARGLVISLQQAAFFPSGEAILSPLARPSLEKVAEAVRDLPHQIRLEGHTDSLPISTTRFRTNWDLASARGAAVLELLETSFGISRQRMAVTAYADTVPLASNDSEEGRARNRRVDITILNEAASAHEPSKNEKRARGAKP